MYRFYLFTFFILFLCSFFQRENYFRLFSTKGKKKNCILADIFFLKV
jgi:hypothetical protein